MDQKQKARWRAIRTRGRWRHIAVMGLLVGIAFVLITSIYEYVRYPETFDLVLVGIRAPVLVLAGLVCAAFMWQFVENRYRERD